MNSRTSNAIKNVAFSMMTQFVNIIVKFVMRTVFIYCLGKEYLGINGVFTNVLSLLSLTELGLGTAIIYSMYKPAAMDDKTKIAQYVKYYQKIYTAIGLMIFAIGLCLLPILDIIVTDVPNVAHIRLIYVLFLLQSATSYFFAQYASLLFVYQKNYEVQRLRLVFSVVKAVAQSLLLILTRMYLVYLFFDIFLSILSNYVIARKAIRLFPFIRNCGGRLSSNEKKEVWRNAFYNFSIRIGFTVINATDNLIISTFISTVLVGLYSNYSLIIQIILATVILLQQALKAGVGNLCVTKSTGKKFETYHNIFFLYGTLFCVIMTCLLSLLQPFVVWWLGESYRLEMSVVVIVVFNCYLSGMHQVNEMFIEADGLYCHFKWKPIAEAAANLGISIFLARQIGLLGVFLGTTVCHFAFTFWYDAYIVYRYSLHEKLYDYFCRYGLYFFSAVIAAGMSYFCSNLFIGVNSLLLLVLKAGIAIFFSAGIWVLCFFRTKEFRYYKKLILSGISHIRGVLPG